MNFEELFSQAQQAAQAASDAAIPQQASWYPCGFAGIVIKPARGKFISWCKENDIGRKHYGGGWHISSYALANQPAAWAQSMTVKEEACQAAANVLEEAGLNVHVWSMID